MRILHAAAYAVKPWKNGGGMTTEIIAEPDGASFDGIDWRISMARVEQAGPFSMLAGIDRSLGILAGEGMVLAVEGRGEVELRAGMHAVVFPGDVPVEARLLGGPVLDLGVMTRRGRFRHHLSRTTASGSYALARRGDVSLAVVCGAGGTVDGRRFDDGDAIRLDKAHNDAVSRLDLDAPCTLWVADLWRLSEP